MKQREHTREIRGRHVLVNRGHNPQRHVSSFAHQRAEQSDALREMGGAARRELTQPKRVRGLKDMWYSTVVQFSKKRKFSQRDGTAIVFSEFFPPIHVAPYTHYDNSILFSRAPCNDVDLTGCVVEGYSVELPEFRDSLLDRMVFARAGSVSSTGELLTTKPPSSFLITSGDFSGASLRGAAFHYVRFAGGTSLRDTDLTGVDFSNVSATGTVDVRGSNITGEQFNDLLGETHGTDDRGVSVEFDFLTAEELAAEHGIDAEALGVLVWSGAVTARCRDGGSLRDVSEFDPAEHVIPVWEAEHLGGVQQLPAG